MKIYKHSIIAAALLMASCSLDYEQYAGFDVYYPNAFVTPDEAVLESAALKDSCIYVSDTEINIQGGFEYAASDVLAYGHCWEKGNRDPLINGDSSNCTIYENFIKSGETFRTIIEGLEHETSYSVRSFVITKNGSIGYNPEVTQITTATPHNKWYNNGYLMADSQKTLKERADGVSIMAIMDDGDTVTYFGLGRDGSSCFNDMYTYSSKKKEYKQISSLPLALWGASGFYMNTEDRNKRKIKRIYVATGCTKADQYNWENYTSRAFVYNIENNKWDEVLAFIDGTNYSDETFEGAGRTGASGFCLYGYGFIGLGEITLNNTQKAYHNDFYTFVMDEDANGNATPERGFFKKMTQNFPYENRTGTSVAVIDDIAYLVGGIGDKGKNFNELIRCTFTPPENSATTALQFSWDKISDKYKFPEGFEGRGYGAAFAIGNTIFYGTGENASGKLYSDMVKYDLTNNNISWCAPFKNGDPNETNKEISRAIVINGGDRAIVGGGYVQGSEKYINTKWVYRP